MNKQELKNAIEKLEPDNDMEYRLAEKLKNHQPKRGSFRNVAAVAACMLVVACAGLVSLNVIGNKPGESNEIAQSSGIHIPKVPLQENTQTSAKMMGLIVYEGRIYLQSALQLEPDVVEGLIGDKIGKTKSNITEWSEQDDYSVEFASTVGIQDVYTVKGYDKSFRIMTYEKIDDKAYAQFYECLNDITVKTGDDIFGKLKIEGNIENAKYELFESWNNGMNELKPVPDMNSLNEFITALNKSVPYEQDVLDSLWEDQSADCQKFINITMKDGTNVQLRVFKEGYVYYNNVNLFFKIDSTVFNNFWDELA